MNDDSELIGIVDGDAQRWMRPQPTPTLTPESRPVTTASINWAKLQETDPAVIVVLQVRRAQGVGWYGDEVHSHNGHDALAHSCQEAVDGYTYATQARMQDDTEEMREICRDWLALITRTVRRLQARDHADQDQPTEDSVPISTPLVVSERTERPVLTRER